MGWQNASDGRLALLLAVTDEPQLVHKEVDWERVENREARRCFAVADRRQMVRSFIKTFEDRKPDPDRDSALVQVMHRPESARFALTYLASVLVYAAQPDSRIDGEQNFLAKSEFTFRQHPVWSSAPPAHQSQAVEVRPADLRHGGVIALYDAQALLNSGAQRSAWQQSHHNSFGMSELL